MDQHSKIFQELGKVWESVDFWVYAVYIMHKYRVHIDTERERDRERERDLVVSGMNGVDPFSTGHPHVPFALD